MPRKVAPGRPAGQYTQAVRLFQLYHRLEQAHDGIRIEALASEMNVTSRSIRRDLRALQEAGQPIESVRLDGEKRIRLAQGRSVEPIRMTRLQRFALAAGRRAFDVLEGTPMHDDLERLWDKLFPPGKDGSNYAERFFFVPEAPKSYKRFKDQIFEIHDAIWRNLTLSFSYEGGSTPGDRRLEPYALVMYRNGLYVVGNDVVKKAPRTFAVERMRKALALPDERFERDPKFNVGRLFQGAFGLAGGKPEKVVVDFDAQVAVYVRERQWHRTQKLDEIRSGLRCTLTVAVGPELIAWILRWGASARVVSPESLVEQVRVETEKMAELYSKRARLPD